MPNVSAYLTKGGLAMLFLTPHFVCSRLCINVKESINVENHSTQTLCTELGDQ